MLLPMLFWVLYLWLVVALGPGKRNDDGTRQEIELKVGDKVLYSKYAGTDIKLGTDEFVLLLKKTF